MKESSDKLFEVKKQFQAAEAERNKLFFEAEKQL